jgi:hypothetical protein
MSELNWFFQKKQQLTAVALNHIVVSVGNTPSLSTTLLA